jgi:hypothetical protein
MYRLTKTGSLAIFTAIRRASSLVAAWVPSELLSRFVFDDKAGVQLFDGPQRREAAGCYTA